MAQGTTKAEVGKTQDSPVRHFFCADRVHRFDLLGTAGCPTKSSLLSQEVKPMFATIYNKIRNLLNREEGQGMVEYALILVLIAVVVLVVLIILGNQVKNVFCNISGGQDEDKGVFDHTLPFLTVEQIA